MKMTYQSKIVTLGDLIQTLDLISRGTQKCKNIFSHFIGSLNLSPQSAMEITQLQAVTAENTSIL